MDFADTQEVAVVVDAVAQVEEIHRMIDIRKMLTEALWVQKTSRGGHEERNEQVNGEFQAGRLKLFISEWEKITSDPQILDIVVH